MNTADNCSKCSLKAVDNSRAMVVLPVPGGPHRMMECGRPVRHHPAQRAFRVQQMVLPHHIGQGFGPQAVGQRARRILGQAAGFKQIGHAA